MLARVSAFFVWALVAAVAVFWALRLLARTAPAPPHANTVSEAVALGGDLTRLFGKPALAATSGSAAPAQPELASRFRLVGVMAPKEGRAPGAGFALIAVDGKPARAFAPGALVDGDLVLQEVRLRSAALGPARGAAAVTLEVPRLAPPVTGTLPPPASPVPPAPARPLLPRPPPLQPLAVQPPEAAAPAPNAARDGNPLTQ
jgi:general secretion pathway protein C